MKKLKLSTVLNITTIIILILSIIFSIYAYKLGLFSSMKSLQNFIKKSGTLGFVLFIIFQAIQVIIPIIPGGITLLAGPFLFGPWLGFLYNYLGIAIGSILAFLISRICGKTLMIKIFGVEKYAKYENWLDNKHFNLIFAIAMFSPISPADFLCYLAGVSTISTLKYIIIILLGKPFSIAAYSLVLVYGVDFINKLF